MKKLPLIVTILFIITFSCSLFAQNEERELYLLKIKYRPAKEIAKDRKKVDKLRAKFGDDWVDYDKPDTLIVDSLNEVRRAYLESFFGEKVFLVSELELKEMEKKPFDNKYFFRMESRSKKINLGHSTTSVSGKDYYATFYHKLFGVKPIGRDLPQDVDKSIYSSTYPYFNLMDMHLSALLFKANNEKNEENTEPLKGKISLVIPDSFTDTPLNELQEYSPINIEIVPEEDYLDYVLKPNYVLCYALSRSESGGKVRVVFAESVTLRTIKKITFDYGNQIISRGNRHYSGVHYEGDYMTYGVEGENRFIDADVIFRLFKD